jgi:hypothetical protein
MSNTTLLLKSNVMHDGKLYQEGSNVDVPDEVAEKWLAAGAAVVGRPRDDNGGREVTDLDAGGTPVNQPTQDQIDADLRASESQNQ